MAAETTEAEDRVRLRAVPMFAYDVNYGDEISVVTSAKGPIVATGVTKNSGNYTFRVWVREDAEDAALRDVVTQFGALDASSRATATNSSVFHVVPRTLSKWRTPSMWPSKKAVSPTRLAVNGLPNMQPLVPSVVPCAPGPRSGRLAPEDKDATLRGLASADSM